MARAKDIIKNLDERAIDRIVEMGWEDRTPFDAIEAQFGVSEGEVIKIMRNQMKPSSFKMWRERVQGRSTKHRAQRMDGIDRFKCSRQRSTGNKIAKR
ncbi:Asl0491 protein [Nonlabens tegetincola]|uniref:Asl0491 protein n=1 Tax=Nonlabens tegetincola TaxID=323273 RepID=A0A090Q1X6_9FLAO|nr:TIGR03643 family protein [Nonlabens tegetincola]GAK96202.1 Asl0491 protein [Nonlabens tegetincola]